MDAIQLGNLGLRAERMLFPREGIDLTRWAVIACDQHTSDVAYWEHVAQLVGDAPSTLHLMLPEAYLCAPDQGRRMRRVTATMARYRADATLRELPAGAMVVERETLAGTRVGVLLGVDLENYDHTGKPTPVRATEQTVVSRIPPRLHIRRQATLELPHTLMLLDDPRHTVIRPLYRALRDTPPLYDFPLMLGGGRIRGWHTSDRAALTALTEALAARAKDAPFLLAAGDGNHSLATAKAYWEEVKASLPPEQHRSHPARYALCEIENLHDDGTAFLPIHRVLTGVPPLCALDYLVDWMNARNMNAGLTLHATQGVMAIHCHFAKGSAFLCIGKPVSAICAKSLQPALDDLLRDMGGELDYIHDVHQLEQLSLAQDSLGLLLPPLDKRDLFAALATGGALPRKTFSMGEEQDKRYYIEGKRLG